MIQLVEVLKFLISTKVDNHLCNNSILNMIDNIPIILTMIKICSMKMEQF